MSSPTTRWSSRPASRRGISGAGGVDGVFTLRTIDDAGAAARGHRGREGGRRHRRRVHRVRGRSESAQHGTVGDARRTGADAARAQAVGTEIGALVTRQHLEKGVTVRAGTGVDEIVAQDGRVTG